MQMQMSNYRGLSSGLPGINQANHSFMRKQTIQHGGQSDSAYHRIR
jgi:hypothetical protein